MRVRSAKNKVGIYALAASYARTAENIPPKELPELNVFPGPEGWPHGVVFKFPLGDLIVDPSDFTGELGQISGQQVEYIEAQAKKLKEHALR